MVTISRERSIIDTFVTLSRTLVEDYDVVDFAQTLVDASAALVDAASAGLVLADARGALEVLASTDEDARLIELLQLNSSGPCIDSYTSGNPVVVPDITQVGERWPEFREQALELGVRAAHCVPLSAHGVTIGSLNLFQARTGTLDPDDVAVIRGFADVAALGVLQRRALQESTTARDQLQHALNSRIVIEQAKGFLAYSNHVTLEQAFAILRSRARSTGTPITTLARQIISGG